MYLSLAYNTTHKVPFSEFNTKQCVYLYVPYKSMYTFNLQFSSIQSNTYNNFLRISYKTMHTLPFSSIQLPVVFRVKVISVVLIKILKTIIHQYFTLKCVHIAIILLCKTICSCHYII